MNLKSDHSTRSESFTADDIARFIESVDPSLLAQGIFPLPGPAFMTLFYQNGTLISTDPGAMAKLVADPPSSMKKLSLLLVKTAQFTLETGYKNLHTRDGYALDFHLQILLVVLEPAKIIKLPAKLTERYRLDDLHRYIEAVVLKSASLFLETVDFAELGRGEQLRNKFEQRLETDLDPLLSRCGIHLNRLISYDYTSQEIERLEQERSAIIYRAETIRLAGENSTIELKVASARDELERTRIRAEHESFLKKQELLARLYNERIAAKIESMQSRREMEDGLRELDKERVLADADYAAFKMDLSWKAAEKTSSREHYLAKLDIERQLERERRQDDYQREKRLLDAETEVKVGAIEFQEDLQRADLAVRTNERLAAIDSNDPDIIEPDRDRSAHDDFSYLFSSPPPLPPAVVDEHRLIFRYRDIRPKIAGKRNVVEFSFHNPFDEAINDLKLSLKARSLDFGTAARKVRSGLLPGAAWNFKTTFTAGRDVHDELVELSFSYRNKRDHIMPYTADLCLNFFSEEQLDTRNEGSVQIADRGGAIYKSINYNEKDYHIAYVKNIHLSAATWRDILFEFDHIGERENNQLKLISPEMVEPQERRTEPEKNQAVRSTGRQTDPKISASAQQTYGRLIVSLPGNQIIAHLYAQNDLAVGREGSTNETLVSRFEPYVEWVSPENVRKSRMIAEDQGLLHLDSKGLSYRDYFGNSLLNGTFLEKNIAANLSQGAILVLPGGLAFGFSMYYGVRAQLAQGQPCPLALDRSTFLFGTEFCNQPFNAVKISRLNNLTREVLSILLLRDFPIGKHPSCLLRLGHGSVEDHHARLIYQSGHFAIMALVVENGLYIDGKPAKTGQAYRLEHGMTIAFAPDVAAVFLA